jgi:hypothetical protein
MTTRPDDAASPAPADPEATRLPPIPAAPEAADAEAAKWKPAPVDPEATKWPPADPEGTKWPGGDGVPETGSWTPASAAGRVPGARRSRLVGLPERAWRWCRRNAAVASLLAVTLWLGVGSAPCQTVQGHQVTRKVPAEADKAQKAEEREGNQAINESVVELSLKGHTNGLTSLAYSPDGKRFVSGSSDGTL